MPRSELSLDMLYYRVNNRGEEAFNVVARKPNVRHGLPCVVGPLEGKESWSHAGDEILLDDFEFL